MIKSLLLVFGMLFVVSSLAFASDSSLVMQATGSNQGLMSVVSVQNENNLLKKMVVKLKQSIQQVEREKRKLIEQNKVLKKALAEAQHHWWNWFSWTGFFETIAGIWLAFFLFAFIRKKFFS